MRPAPKPPHQRGAWLLAATLLAAALAIAALGLSPLDLIPTPGGRALLADFLSAALSPLTSREPLSATDPGLLTELLAALQKTLIFAAASLSLAIPLSLPLALFASDAWWELLGRRAPALQALTRTLIALLRSIHELLWAVLLLAAFGLSPATGVLALAIPFTGTLAKVFAELLDETPRSSALALSAIGGRPAQVFLLGLTPRALPDLAAYSFYRFECAVRSSAVLGFFGFPTLGYHLRANFEDQRYREVWTYLYALILLVLILEGLSALLRRRFLA